MFQEVEEADETGEQLEAGETERAAEQAKMIGTLFKLLKFGGSSSVHEDVQKGMPPEKIVMWVDFHQSYK